MRLVSRERSRSLESYIIEKLGVSVDILAERAGIALANACLENIRKAERHSSTVDIFAGKGMNGTDALICARELFAADIPVRIWIMGTDLPAEEESWQLKACRNLGIDLCDAHDFEGTEAAVIVDGLYGTAFDPERGTDKDVEQIITSINESGECGSYVISADIPSGVDCNSGIVTGAAVKANETVTFIAPKTGLYSYPGRMFSGKIKLERLGIPAGLIADFLDKKETGGYVAEAITNECAAAMLPKRIVDSHKGTFGRVVVAGGSEGMAGAVCLCAQACYRSGAGLVCLIVPDSIRKDCLCAVPEALTFSSTEDLPFKSDVMVIGPGGEKTHDFADLVFIAIASAERLILDAQALHVLADDPQKAKKALLERTANGSDYVIITPHPGEIRRLLPDWDGRDRIKAARDAAREFNCICVLKGAGTVISDPQGSVMINTTGNSSMAKGGSGDILAGIIGAISAQGKASTEAAALGVFLHGLCGDLAAKDKGEYCARPVDVLDKIPDGFRIILKEISGNE